MNMGHEAFAFTLCWFGEKLLIGKHRPIFLKAMQYLLKTSVANLYKTNTIKFISTSILRLMLTINQDCFNKNVYFPWTNISLGITKFWSWIAAKEMFFFKLMPFFSVLCRQTFLGKKSLLCFSVLSNRLLNSFS